MSPVESIGVRELRQNASFYLALVKRGQTVEVTERGTPVALLIPTGPAGSLRDRLVAEGRLVSAPVPADVRRLPSPLAVRPGDPTNAELLDAGRAGID